MVQVFGDASSMIDCVATAVLLDVFMHKTRPTPKKDSLGTTGSDLNAMIVDYVGFLKGPQ